ncbi:unnamed protein product [Mucor hiemalis]
MGVQDVVARLNKSKSATTTTTTTPQPKRKILVIGNNENKILPPSPASSPTNSIQKQDNTTNNNKNISNILQKFGQPPTYTSRPITTPTAIATATPPESPTAVTTQSIKKNVTPSKFDHNKVDVTLNEIEELYQKLVDQNKAAEEYIEKLQKDVEKFSSDATKVRDYEIRVEYLALKLEQVSEERDMFEKELLDLQLKSSKQQTEEAPVSPMSPAYTYQHDIVIEEEQKLHNQNNDAYMADILNVYEEISDRSEDDGEGDHMQLFEAEEEEDEHLVDVQSQQQQDCDRGMQMAIVKYVTDLETQKLETKALKEVVKKQDELITKLENKVRAAEVSSEDELLKEQVQVQRVELENKRELLAQLLNEREDLLRRLNSNQRKSRRSSIELISHMLKDNRPNSYSSITSGRGTPPLTAPPKQPLPPLPPK